MKVVRIPGCMSKFEGKTRIIKGVNAKKWKIPRVIIKMTGNPEGVNFKKIDILNRGYNFFPGKGHCSYSV